MIWTRELGEGAVSGVTTKAKWRHWASSPPLNARMRAKVKSCL